MGIIDQKRIARNTLMLYFRMGLIMLISLYTSRVVLSALGVVDYGLFGAVGGIVVGFSFLNGVMSAACSRYFSIELGKGDFENLKKVFSLNLTVFLVLGLIILLLSETLGLWFLNHKMSFPVSREGAVNIVFQFSIASFLVSMFSTPYRAVITSREKMDVFAYVSVAEAVCKLGVAYALCRACFDKLVLYSALVFAVCFLTSIFYVLYCRAKFEECHYSFYWNGRLFKEIVGYTGWNSIGALAGIGKSQGVNILLNMFCGPAVNAARQVAYQVFASVNQYVQGFITASSPQIIKSYSAGESSGMMKLVLQSSKFSFYLLLFFAIPVCVEAPFLLDIWLKEVPEHAVSFTRLMLIAAMIDSIGFPLAFSVQATGNVRNYQIVVGGIMLLTLPVAYVMLKIGRFSPESVFVAIVVFNVMAQVARVVFVSRMFGLTFKRYWKDVLSPIIIVTLAALVAPLLFKFYLRPSIWSSLLVIISGILSVSASVLFLGMTRSERSAVVRVFASKFSRR